MQKEIIIAGFGGQGIVFLGNLLALTLLKENKNVTFFKSYGLEIRGGTANSIVISSDEEIPSPVVSFFSYGIIMNSLSLEKFAPRIKKEGLIIIDTSLILYEEIKRSNIEIISIRATEIAEQMGNSQIANVIMLGKFIKVTKIVSLNTVRFSLEEILKSKPYLLKLNQEALQIGFETD